MRATPLVLGRLGDRVRRRGEGARRFPPDCCDREAIGYVATAAGISAEDVRDLIMASVEHRFGQMNRLPRPIEWMTDNGSCFTARDTRRFARDIGLIPPTTPIESPYGAVREPSAFCRT